MCKKLIYLASFVLVLDMVLTALSLLPVAVAQPEARQAKQIFEVTGIKGGLIVHVGCGDGQLAASLGASDGYLVHGIDVDARKVGAARRHIQSLGLYGRVSVDTFDGKQLPYADNLVNLLVAEDLGDVPMDEVMRVLCPLGATYIKNKGKWTMLRKPWPDDIDEWTHFLHDATGNPAGNDTKVGPPRYTHWEDGPKWTRSHENMSSVSAVVSSGGRIFSIIDEGPKASIYLKPKWFLTARDAFNGVVLWKKPLEQWQSHLFRLKQGPFQLPRRLIAIKNSVYTTLGLFQPVSEIDAATGQIKRSFEDTAYTEEILYSDGKLILVVSDNKEPVPFEDRGNIASQYTVRLVGERSIVVVNLDSGKTLWEKKFGNITTMTTSADDGRVLFHANGEINCLDVANGDVLWKVEAGRKPNKLWYAGPVLLLSRGVVCFTDGEQITGISAKDGKKLWTIDCHVSCYRTPSNILAIDGVIWVPNSSSSWETNYWGKNRIPKGSFVGYDLLTGKKVREFPIDISQGIGFLHHRCHMPKATGKYFIAGWGGIDFIDTTTEKMSGNAWVRGACVYGIMPANGLIYAPPNPCACYPDGKLLGFQALSHVRTTNRSRRPTVAGTLEKGEAYSEERNQKPSDIEDQWPTYRHDSERTGHTIMSIPSNLKQLWKTKLPGKITPPVISDGKLVVASIDTHTVYALNAKSGTKLWSYTVGGRVDSPPTYHKGMFIFGARDGCVYSVDADTGELIWRFTAAREDRRIVSYGQLESVYPVNGSVLVQDDTVYFAAGKSSYLDDGIWLYRLDPASGKKLSETQVYLLDSQGNQPKNRGRGLPGLEMDGALPDVLSSDNEYVYMRHFAFDLKGNIADNSGGNHIYATTGFLDDTDFHRIFWSYSNGPFVARSGRGGKWGPGSRIIVMDKDRLFYFGRSLSVPRIQAPHEKYFLSSALRDNVAVPKSVKTKTETRSKKKSSTSSESWQNPILMRVRAMLLANQTLFIAGAKGDWLSSQDAYEGANGIALIAVSASDGKTIAEHTLPAHPVFDGMSAAYGRLYVSLQNGSVVCFAGE